MTAALHLVPEPDGEPAAEPTEKPPPAPPAEEPGEQPTPAEDDDAEPGEYDEDEEPAPRRALAMPDLRPYASLMWIPDVINAGIAATRRARKRARQTKAARRAAGEPPARRQLLAIAVTVAKGSGMLIHQVLKWIGGEGGPDSAKVPHRLGIALGAAYCCYKTATTWPETGPTALIGAWGAAAVVVAERARVEAPEDAERKPTRKASRIFRKRSGQPPAELVDEAADGAAEEAPADPSPEAIARALHALVGEGRGVLLTTLRQALGLADTRAVRRVLTEAGIRVRPGVRTAAGNGPGVHLSDFPARPSSPAPALGGAVVAGQSANANANNAESGAQKGLGVDGSEPDDGRPFDIVQDSERGPAAWKVVPRAPR
ncbi:hypothetical protein [Streptomyces carpinensis]|uniref:DUF2637 domain-containing protein n=1 Tax=Streptomyces carpinensis TaxID=66369 RepID=A0ABV1W8M8_9ACTN|nr:hypothetical protein [Streptomyces carpinensis]